MDRGLAVAALLMLIAACSLAAQSRTSVVVDSATATVGFALHLPSGTAQDPLGEEGATALVASALELDLAERTRGLAVRTQIRFDRAGVTVWGQAAPGLVPELIETIRGSVFERPLPAPLLERVRRSQVARLRFQSGAPVRAFQDLVARLVYAPHAAWSRPESGSLSSVQNISVERLALAPAFDSTVRAGSSAALVGPLEPESSQALLEGLLGTRPMPGANAGARPAPSQHHAWAEAEQQHVEADITTSWVAVALPIDRNTPDWKARLLVHHVAEVLNRGLPSAGLVSPNVQILSAGDFPVLLVTFAIAPERATDWVDRVLSAARLETDAPYDESFFQWNRRRFRADWLLDHAGPDARAAQLSLHQTGAAWGSDGSGLDIEVSLSDLADGARALGLARVLVYGPAPHGPEGPDS